MIIQVLATIFVAIVLFNVFKKYRNQELNVRELSLWVVFWLIVIVVFWLPESTTYLAKIFGIGRGADLVIYVAILVLSYSIFRIFVRLDSVDRHITKIVRKIALDETQRKEKK